MPVGGGRGCHGEVVRVMVMVIFWVRSGERGVDGGAGAGVWLGGEDRA